MTEYVAAKTSEFDDTERLVVELEGKEIGLFEVDGEYHALLNWCVHQGGPCCEGPVTGTKRAEFDRDSLETEVTWEREDEILTCPWHGWEYDITSGECLSNRRYRLPEYPVRIDGEEILVDLG